MFCFEKKRNQEIIANPGKEVKVRRGGREVFEIVIREAKKYWVNVKSTGAHI